MLWCSSSLLLPWWSRAREGNTCAHVCTRVCAVSIGVCGRARSHAGFSGGEEGNVWGLQKGEGRSLLHAVMGTGGYPLSLCGASWGSQEPAPAWEVLCYGCCLQPLSLVLPVPWHVLMDGAVLEHPWQRCPFWGETEALPSAFPLLPKPFRDEVGGVEVRAAVAHIPLIFWCLGPSCPLHVVPSGMKEHGLLKALQLMMLLLWCSVPIGLMWSKTTLVLPVPGSPEPLLKDLTPFGLCWFLLTMSLCEIPSAGCLPDPPAPFCCTRHSRLLAGVEKQRH